MEINEQTETFLWELLEPEPVKLEALRYWLGYTMEKESILSALITSMRRNYMKAKSIIAEVEECFKKLNEKNFQDCSVNSEIEIRTYNKAIRPFEDYIMRGEALRTRLRIVMEEIRTYLSLQEQKISIEEQKASKEQLVRLVNLQEIFHKIEIFIVAVYIMEMFRIIFEVLAHEIANLLVASPYQ